MGGDELGIWVTAAVALTAGIIRGFTGFGGPAVMVIMLTIFYPPIAVVSKVMIVDFVAGSFLFHSQFARINWRNTLALAIPSMVMMPLGQWILIVLDPDLMGKAIALIILASSLLMLSGWRFKKVPGTIGLLAVGIVSGVVFGATYVALIVVAAVLLGPWDRHEARTLIISWAFMVSVWFVIISIIAGTVVVNDLLIALPGAGLYLFGTWAGSRLFRGSGESRYRNVALFTLIGLSVIGLIS